MRSSRSSYFCGAVTDLVKRKQHKHVTTDEAWNRVLDEQVHHGFLRKTIEQASNNLLLAPVAVYSTVKPMPLTHILIRRLLASMKIENTSNVSTSSSAQNDEDSASKLIRRQHALEMLAVLIGALLARQYVDFEEQALRLICRLEDSEEIFGRMLEQVSQIVVSEDEIALEALIVMLAMTMACEHLQRNSLLDHFRVRHEEVSRALFTTLGRPERTAQHEAAFAELGLLCHHRKHESRNMFAQHLRECSINDTHRYIFSLRGILEDLNSQFVRCTTGTYQKQDQDDIFGWVDMASESMINWGGQLTSSLGAWITGFNSDGKSDHPSPSSIDSSISAAGRKPCDPPVLSQDPLLVCDAALWARAQLVLLYVYEVFSMRGRQGENVWLRVLAEHDSPPWAAADGHSLPQPLGCGDVFLDVITFLTFSLHGNTKTPYSTHIALLVLRCLTENVQILTLLFAVSFENASNVDGLRVFERQKSVRDGILAYVPAVKQQQHQQQNKGGTGSSGASSEGEAYRRSLENMSMQVVEKSLAATLFQHVAMVLLEHARTDADGSQEQIPEDHPRHGAGAVCARAVDILHRLIIFQKRTFGTNAPQGASRLLGIDWVLVTRGLFALVDRLAKGPKTFSGFTPERFIDICIHVIHLLNLLISSDLQDERSRVLFLLEILKHRKVVEDLVSVLERDPSLVDLGGPRIVQQDLGNLRHILTHFMGTVALIEDEQAQELTGANRSKRDMEILGHLAERVSSLRLRPHDRLRDGFQRYVETQHERALLRDFIVRTISDCNSLHVFENKVFSARRR